MIPSTAVREFLRRPRDNHDWMKRLTVAEVDEALHGLTPRPWVHPETSLHQKVAVLLGIAFPQFCYWLDLGTGKTLVALTLLRYCHEHLGVRRGIVTLPTDESMPGWEDQIRDWQTGLPFISLTGDTSKFKWELLSEFDHGLILVTYPGLARMVSVKKKVAKGKYELVRNKDAIDLLCEDVGAVAYDEITKLGNPKSLQHQVCNRISAHTKYRFGLAGRPLGRNPELMWAQYYLVDRGETLGDTLSLFRAAFFSAKRSWWGGPYSMEYTLKKSMEPQLSAIMKHRSITYEERECFTLPPRLATVEHVHFPEDTEVYYQRVVDAMRLARGSYRELKNGFIRARQVSSGFLGFKDDETGEKAEVEFRHNPKLDRLMELLEEIPPGKKFIIFHEFTWSGHRLMSALAKARYKAEWLWSGNKDPRASLDFFKHSPEADGLVINHKVGAYSLNLQEANYCFFFESPVACIDREQAEKRIWRRGQKWTTHQYDLVVDGTYDERILEFHREGSDVWTALKAADPMKILDRTARRRA